MAGAAARKGPSLIYVVDLTIETAEPITTDMLESAASIGGNAAGTAGQNRLETILSVEAEKLSTAIDEAFRLLEIAGSIIAAEVMTEAEADRRLAESPSFEMAHNA